MVSEFTSTNRLNRRCKTRPPAKARSRIAINRPTEIWTMLISSRLLKIRATKIRLKALKLPRAKTLKELKDRTHEVTIRSLHQLCLMSLSNRTPIRRATLPPAQTLLKLTHKRAQAPTPKQRLRATLVPRRVQAILVRTLTLRKADQLPRSPAIRTFKQKQVQMPMREPACNPDLQISLSRPITSIV